MNNIKQLFVTIMILFCSTTLLTGCESDEEKASRVEHERIVEIAKLNNGQYAIEKEQEHERRMAYIERPRMPVAPGSYIDYRGNTMYGSWDIFGNWVWHDRNSLYATQSRRYVDYQISTGALATGYLAHALTRDRWESNHRDGWTKTNITVNNYTSVNGKTLSKEKYNSNLKTAEVKNNKWKKDKKTQSTYAKGGFKNKFAKNKAVADGKATGSTKDAKGKVVTNKPNPTDKLAKNAVKPKGINLSKPTKTIKPSGINLSKQAKTVKPKGINLSKKPVKPVINLSKTKTKVKTKVKTKSKPPARQTRQQTKTKSNTKR